MDGHSAETPLYARGPVRVRNGSLRGCAAPEDDSVSTFKGIPFAAPPVGDLRWRPPAPAQDWDGVRDATSFGPACLQPVADSLAMFGPAKGAPLSEDCLYLNVWTPARSAGEKRPVMVWIFGGALRVGSADNPMYNAVNLAKAGVVVVTVTYRLNVLGGFAHPWLTAESENGASGNYGLMDQVAALRWVRENIGAFGGDAGNVTVFGESAGSRSIAVLMCSPLAEGLFDRGICQSGALRDVSSPREAREAQGIEIAAKLGCTSLAALRAKPWHELFDALAMDNNPMVDGWVVPDDPRRLYAQGKIHSVPLIIGINADEGTMFTQGEAHQFDTVEKYRSFLGERFGGEAAAIFDAYPATTDSGALDAVAHLSTDQRMALPARRHAQWLSRAGIPCWFYYFTRTPPWRGGTRMGAHHGAEIPYIFGSGVKCGQFGSYPTDHDREISDTIMGYWTRFAATGDPNRPDLPRWPAFEADTHPYLEIGDTVAAGTELLKPQLDFLETLRTDRTV
jgi:para-nitrobenzyl esterase